MGGTIRHMTTEEIDFVLSGPHLVDQRNIILTLCGLTIPRDPERDLWGMFAESVTTILIVAQCHECIKLAPWSRLEWGGGDS